MHAEDATHLILSSGVLIERTEQIGKEVKTLDGKYVKVLGLFKAGGKHTVPFSGSIMRIEKCELWSDPRTPISQRIRQLPGVSSNP